MQNVLKFHLLFAVVITLFCAGTATAQSKNRARLPKGFEYRNLRLPYSREIKKYAVQKVPVSKGSGFSYYLLGDIIVGTDKPQNRFAIDSTQLLWRGDVPLKIDSSVIDSDMCAPLILAINHFHKYTKVRFVPYTNQPDFITIRIADAGQYLSGYSAIGRRIDGQEIVIEKASSYAVFEHEMMHALGVIHEHQRPDRDQYIKYNPQNLIVPALSGQFAKYTTARTFTPYDYNSVMHYPPSGTMAKPGTLVMECKNGNQLISCPVYMGHNELSANDIAGLNELYKNVQFSSAHYTSPGINIPPTGNKSGYIYISWDPEEVQMQNVIYDDIADRLVRVTAKNAFKLNVTAPQTIINFDQCVWAYANESAFNPVLTYKQGTDFSPRPRGDRGPEKFDTIPNATITMPVLPVPFPQLSIVLDINEKAWKAGWANPNPYRSHGVFLVWAELTRFDIGMQNYEVHAAWIDDRKITSQLRGIINRFGRRRIQSDGPMHEWDGYGPGDPR